MFYVLRLIFEVKVTVIIPPPLFFLVHYMELEHAHMDWRMASGIDLDNTPALIHCTTGVWGLGYILY
jgi:hypothetical protein